MKSQRSVNANPLIAQIEIDLLVMNELSATETEELCHRLDREVDGWRRCGLAFIESRNLAVKLKSLLDGDNAVESGFDLRTGTAGDETQWRMKEPLTRLDSRTSSPHQETLPSARVHAFWFAAAATWMIAAFCAGRFFVPESGPHADTGAALQTVDEQWPTGLKFVENDRFQGRIANTEALRQLSWSFQAANEPEVEVVALVDIGSDTTNRFVPIVASERLEREIEMLPQPRVAPEIGRELQQAGWELETRRRLLAVSLPDGSRSLMPIDSVNYRYVGRNTY